MGKCYKIRLLRLENNSKKGNKKEYSTWGLRWPTPSARSKRKKTQSSARKIRCLTKNDKRRRLSALKKLVVKRKNRVQEGFENKRSKGELG